MNQKIENATREQVAEFLPDAIKKALASYKKFLEKEEFADAKGFKAHHDAGKVALAHIKLLLDLAHWAELPDENVDDEDLSELIKAAETELNKSV